MSFELYILILFSDFVPLTYEHCVYFGNFAYVHGYKYEDADYGEDQYIVKSALKNPPYV